MALVTCPDCKREISTEALSCPNCGRPSANVYCKHCGKENKNYNASCISCGRSLSTAPMFQGTKANMNTASKGGPLESISTKKLLWGGAVFIVFVSIISMFSDKPKSGVNDQERRATSSSTEGPHMIFDVAITAERLANEYRANEIKADANYKGKILSVTGNVDRIGKDVLDTMYITFQSENIVSAQAFFDNAFASRLANLQKGEFVTVTCKCDGKFGNVLLKECTLR